VPAPGQCAERGGDAVGDALEGVVTGRGVRQDAGGGAARPRAPLPFAQRARPARLDRRRRAVGVALGATLFVVVAAAVVIALR